MWIRLGQSLRRGLGCVDVCLLRSMLNPVPTHRQSPHYTRGRGNRAIWIVAEARLPSREPATRAFRENCILNIILLLEFYATNSGGLTSASIWAILTFYICQTPYSNTNLFQPRGSPTSFEAELPLGGTAVPVPHKASEPKSPDSCEIDHAPPHTSLFNLLSIFDYTRCVFCRKRRGLVT
jgi:hypothetical protein